MASLSNFTAPQGSNLGYNRGNLRLSDCTCPICMYILIEPVTMPCNHELCMPCFQKNVQETNLCCPLCRKRISTWARRATRNNNLVNQSRWKQIREAFPQKVTNRLEGVEDEDDEEEDETAFIHVPNIAEPGEIREEYEKELQKLETEREQLQRAEEQESRDLIARLQAEEEASRREQEEIIRQDEELVRKIMAEGTPARLNTTPKVTLLDRFVNRAASRTSTCTSASTASSSLEPGPLWEPRSPSQPSPIPPSRSLSSTMSPTPSTSGTQNRFVRVLDESTTSLSADLNVSPGLSSRSTSNTTAHTDDSVESLPNENNLQIPRLLAQRSESPDSLKLEMCHFKPIHASPKTPTRLVNGKPVDPPVIMSTPRNLSNLPEKPQDKEEPMSMVSPVVRSWLQKLARARIEKVASSSKCLGPDAPPLPAMNDISPSPQSTSPSESKLKADSTSTARKLRFVPLPSTSTKADDARICPPSSSETSTSQQSENTQPAISPDNTLSSSDKSVEKGRKNSEISPPSATNHQPTEKGDAPECDVIPVLTANSLKEFCVEVNDGEHLEMPRLEKMVGECSNRCRSLPLCSLQLSPCDKRAVRSAIGTRGERMASQGPSGCPRQGTDPQADKSDSASGDKEPSPQNEVIVDKSKADEKVPVFTPVKDREEKFKKKSGNGEAKTPCVSAGVSSKLQDSDTELNSDDDFVYSLAKKPVAKRNVSPKKSPGRKPKPKNQDPSQSGDKHSTPTKSRQRVTRSQTTPPKNKDVPNRQVTPKKNSDVASARKRTPRKRTVEEDVQCKQKSPKKHGSPGKREASANSMAGTKISTPKRGKVRPRKCVESENQRKVSSDLVDVDEGDGCLESETCLDKTEPVSEGAAGKDRIPLKRGRSTEDKENEVSNEEESPVEPPKKRSKTTPEKKSKVVEGTVSSPPRPAARTVRQHFAVEYSPGDDGKTLKKHPKKSINKVSGKASKQSKLCFVTSPPGSSLKQTKLGFMKASSEDSGNKSGKNSTSQARRVGDGTSSGMSEDGESGTEPEEAPKLKVLDRSCFQSDEEYRHHLEEQDRLLAIQLQADFDLEAKLRLTAIRRKGSEGQYEFRRKVTSTNCRTSRTTSTKAKASS